MDINWYKKIIKSQKLRLIILKFFWFIPNKTMLKIQYKIKLGRKLNIKEPKRFTEKIQNYKIEYKNPILHQVVDKYKVRSYIEKLNLQNYLVKFYGVYDSFKDIDFNNLPNKFVMKSTNGGGGNEVFLINKKNLDIKKLKKQTKGWTKKSNSRWDGREYAYNKIKGKILIEEMLENKGKHINDYKIMCFNGQPKYIILDVDRFTNHKRNIYDLEWNHLKINTDKEFTTHEQPKPENFDEMISLATTLSKDFPFVRVDLYNIEGKIYFGELTFYPWSGYVSFSPDDFDFKLGDLFDYYKN